MFIPHDKYIGLFGSLSCWVAVFVVEIRYVDTLAVLVTS